MTAGWSLLLQIPLDPSRDQARGWAVGELARPEYQAEREGPLMRALRWLFERLSDVQLNGSPGSALGIGIAVVLLAAVVGYALWRTGGLGRQARRTAPHGVFTDHPPRSAAEHRAAAERAAAAADWSTAVVERFRAVVRELEERTVLTAQPGRTADESARAAAIELPSLASELASGARMFDDVRYGDRTATPATDAALRALDSGVRAADLVPR